MRTETLGGFAAVHVTEDIIVTVFADEGVRTVVYAEDEPFSL